MTASSGSTAGSAWRQHRLKVAGVALVAALAWLVYYLEYIPVSRDFSADESKLTLVADDDNEAVRLGGVPAGPLGTFRLVSAKRLVVTIKGSADMILPELQPFLAKAARQKAELSSISCGEDYIVIDAGTQPKENATVELSLEKDGTNKADDVALLIAKAPREYRDGILVRADGAKLDLAVGLNRSDENPAAGTMSLCRKGVTATLGQAEFELSPGQPVYLEFRDPDPSAASLPPARFDLQNPLAVSSIAVGHLGEKANFEPERIACGTTAKGQKLWGKFLPDVAFADCKAGSLSVTEIPVKGEMKVKKAPAYFSNYYADKDTAHWVKNATSNLVVQALILGLIAGKIIPWLFDQFRGSNRRASPRKARGSRRAKK